MKTIIAECGASHCDWAIAGRGSENTRFRTAGFNPQGGLLEAFLANLNKERYRFDPIGNGVVYFFGAGLRTEGQKEAVRDGLSRFFDIPDDRISVEDDLLGAALSVSEGEPCLVCILGTGVNAGHFDGVKVTGSRPSLGYILGDEGGGAYFGKRLLAAYFDGSLPAELGDRLAEAYPVELRDVLENVYEKPGAAGYLGSYVPFLSDKREHPFIRRMLQQGFRLFFEKRIFAHPEYQVVPVHFTGGVACAFEPVLRELAGDMGIRCGRFVPRPIEGLIRRLANKKAV